MGIIIARIIGLIATIGIGAGINYLALPAWDLRNPSLWAFFLVVIIIGVIIQVIIDFYEDENFVGSKIGGGIVAAILVVMLIGGLTSAKMFNASNYQHMIEMSEGNFEKDINKVDNVENISIVDMETAERLGDRTIGSIKNSAWYEVDDEYNLIKYHGEQYRISALNYGGYWKSQKAKYDGIPGYVLVNTSTQEAKYVELEEGMKYSPSAHWSFDLKRHLRGQYPNSMFSEHYFEIDEAGNPYWITGVKQTTIGMFGGKKENSFIITNACTGESKEYKTEELPEWVDHAYSLDYLMRIAEYNLKYVNGYWNAVFSKTNVLNTTYSFKTSGSEDTEAFDGYNTAITANGEIVFYTGLTPASNAESNVGFILANPRTGVITRYTCSGAEESSAQDSAESLVQDLKYIATFPSILNVEGEETYFMLLKDKAGLVQRYALCNVENYTKVVQALTLEEAVEQYLVKLGKEDSKKEDAVETKKTEGKIKELYQAQLDGCTYYYFTIEGSDNLYMSSIKNSNKQVMLKVGTKVSIKYVSSSEEKVFLVKTIEF